MIAPHPNPTQPTPTQPNPTQPNPTPTPTQPPLQIKAHPWAKVFSKRMPPEAVDLIARLLVYSPARRMTAAEGMTHAFFDELRDPGAKLPNGAIGGVFVWTLAWVRGGGLLQWRLCEVAMLPAPRCPHPMPRTAPPPGRPLPPLFNWAPGELDHYAPEVLRVLQASGTTAYAGKAPAPK